MLFSYLSSHVCKNVSQTKRLPRTPFCPPLGTHRCHGLQGAPHLLKFTTPLGMPVGVLKAGSSFSPNLMAFTRNTCQERSKGTEFELGGVKARGQDWEEARCQVLRPDSLDGRSGSQIADFIATDQVFLSVSFCVPNMPVSPLRW